MDSLYPSTRDLEQILGQIVTVRVKTLSNKNLVASWHTKREKSLTVGRRSYVVIALVPSSLNLCNIFTKVQYLSLNSESIRNHQGVLLLEGLSIQYPSSRTNKGLLGRGSGSPIY